jgi:hypothetical protein
MDPGNSDPGELVTIVFDYGDGTQHTFTKRVRADGSIGKVVKTYSYPEIDSTTTWKPSVSVTDSEGEYAQWSSSIQVKPANDDAGDVTKFGVDVSAPDQEKRGDWAGILVSESNIGTRAPPKVLVTFGDGEQKLLDPADTGEFSTRVFHRYGSTGSYTVSAAVMGHSSNAQVEGGTDTITIVAETYRVYSYTERERKTNTEYKVTTGSPGSGWSYVTVVRSESKWTGEQITQPKTFPAPSHSTKTWKQHDTSYDPITEMYMVTYRLYETTSWVKYKKTMKYWGAGGQVTSLNQPADSEYMSGTLSTTTYSCTNQDAPYRNRACSESSGGGTT